MAVKSHTFFPPWKTLLAIQGSLALKYLTLQVGEEDCLNALQGAVSVLQSTHHVGPQHVTHVSYSIAIICPEFVRHDVLKYLC